MKRITVTLIATLILASCASMLAHAQAEHNYWTPYVQFIVMYPQVHHSFTFAEVAIHFQTDHRISSLVPDLYLDSVRNTTAKLVNRHIACSDVTTSTQISRQNYSNVSITLSAGDTIQYFYASDLEWQSGGAHNVSDTIRFVFEVYNDKRDAWIALDSLTMYPYSSPEELILWDLRNKGVTIEGDSVSINTSVLQRYVFTESDFPAPASAILRWRLDCTPDSEYILGRFISGESGKLSEYVREEIQLMQSLWKDALKQMNEKKKADERPKKL